MSDPSPRRPRITPSAHVAGAVSTVAGVLALAAAVSPMLLTFALAAAVVALAWGWAGALSLPTPRGSVGVIVVGGLALVLAVGTRQEGPWLVWVPAALSISMIAAFAHQLFRRDGRPRLVVSVSSVVLALTLAAVGVLMVPPTHTLEGTGLVLGALAAAAASAGSDLLGRWPSLRGWLVPLAMVAGGVAAVIVALVLDAPWTTWLLVGVSSAVLSQAVRAVLAPLPTLALPRPRLVTAIASVLVVGAVPYLVALVLVQDAIA